MDKKQHTQIDKPAVSRKENYVGLVGTQYFSFAEPPEVLQLQSGLKLGPVTLAYETYGSLNADKSNAVLVCNALSGYPHAAGVHKDDVETGW